MANPDTIKAYNAAVDISPYLIVKFGANDYDATLAAASTDSLVGVSGGNGGVGAKAGQRIDVIHEGIAYVKLGGTVTRGDFITSDASGQGISAAPAAGVNAQVIGKAIVSGVLGDVIPVLLQIGRIQG